MDIILSLHLYNSLIKFTKNYYRIPNKMAQLLEIPRNPKPFSRWLPPYPIHLYRFPQINLKQNIIAATFLPYLYQLSWNIT